MHAVLADTLWSIQLRGIEIILREEDELALTFVTTEDNFEETIPIFEEMVASFRTVDEEE